ncbi:MAG: DUF839 domain-containing protein [Betaproteobacteria bacterium]|nr:DUF839 domain-containing protein [Betaproteobacteria bacterium]
MANPRAAGVFNHIVRWREGGRRQGATAPFRWDIYARCGDPRHARRRGQADRRRQERRVHGARTAWVSTRAGSVDQTDVSTSTLNRRRLREPQQQRGAGPRTSPPAEDAPVPQFGPAGYGVHRRRHDARPTPMFNRHPAPRRAPSARRIRTGPRRPRPGRTVRRRSAPTRPIIVRRD